MYEGVNHCSLSRVTADFLHCLRLGACKFTPSQPPVPRSTIFRFGYSANLKCTDYSFRLLEQNDMRTFHTQLYRRRVKPYPLCFFLQNLYLIVTEYFVM